MQQAASVMQFLNTNTGAITGLATVALLLVTGWYAWTTRALLKEAQQTRLMASEPRVVAYLRVHEIHGNIVQLCIANLSAAAATGVSASVDKVTDWPTKFDFGDIKILRDLSFLRPHEVLRFDLGYGPNLFHDGQPAVFKAAIKYESLDGRPFTFEDTLQVESVAGFGNWRVYGIDDVARRLEEISKTLSAFSGGRRLNVDSFSAADWKEEERAHKERRSQNAPGQRE
ncbi:hypothetical protein [Shinella fusca]|uniref:Uncharacterized protein n=1 Tax=Shinella fusca TaxID=544480 RepID=A0A7W7YZ27_9HYPH|nr:hypothetical protein [Shinella fusca]MBB5044994.1 hypothetical protein [Shinella fusca]